MKKPQEKSLRLSLCLHIFASASHLGQRILVFRTGLPGAPTASVVRGRRKMDRSIFAGRVHRSAGYRGTARLSSLQHLERRAIFALVKVDRRA
jgi:hypothetical protein